MSLTHLSFYSAFTLSSLGLAFHRTHLISALLCLESMMLSMYVALSLWPIENQTTSSTLVPVLMLAFSACEAGTGLAMLVASTRTHGSDHLHNLNLLQC
uniref:NADH-ubiquinone oxidoreductase chain 4L n=2 Tax=Stercorarius TaxID=54057 RepID=A0A0U1XZJ2_STEMC|nr:NADH dehydrogenase subunit 4L [Stercorarius maccormicki]YP_010691179.1 NADH dehydrogenase subunit 4L [Stercorarius pomarinus]YP_010691192.1 NADH dehydrogenase subunit 4L [Stercorarius lonnbergi]YP_010691205.1 NADH dehydrogenase subunit 4L [Stercorarius skua]YP_010691218.1 NADH dehydrogenase subunit 4L [Stercorarius chilensis]ABD58751.1 NADH dehydrogenase subunit 4L [Stercorarius skua]AJA05086.1 NADH dehydrogenase subunit 4L [Stercorarius maccormicki]UQV81433.1 NADH dehydrogenase subunit 4